MKIEFAMPPRKRMPLIPVGERQFIYDSKKSYTLKYRVIEGRNVKNRVYHVPPGFRTDLGSVPRLLRWLVSVADAPRAFVVHDYLYLEQPTTITRQEADAVMLALMRYFQAPGRRSLRLVAWSGVRAGGWIGWRRNAQAKNAPGKKTRRTR